MPEKTKVQIPFRHVAERVFDRPHLIQHSKLLTILRVLGPRLGIEEIDGKKLKAMEDDDWIKRDPFEHMEHLQALGIGLEPMGEGHFVGEGVAVIPVYGTLVQRSDMITDASGMISYGRIERMMVAADADPRVKEMVWEFDTPGGEVAGAFDFSDRIHDYRKKGGKPMRAAINELAASAGYLLASAVGDISISRTGGAGSIGVVASHYDYSKAMDKRGVVVTLLYAGEKKVDGNPFEPLSARAKSEWQDEIDNVYGLFVETVARNTGMSADKVRGTKAGMYLGAKAVDAGLAARVNTFTNEATNAVLRARNPQTRYVNNPEKETHMQDSEKSAKAKAAREWLTANVEGGAKAIEGKSDDDVIKMHADGLAKIEAAKTAPPAPAAGDVAAAVTAERARAKAIRALPEAQGRGQLAETCIDQGMTVDQAKTILAAAPKKTGLSDAMETNGGGAGVRGEEEREVTLEPVASYAETYDFYNKQMEKGRQPAGR